MPTVQNITSKEGKMQIVDSSGNVIDVFASNAPIEPGTGQSRAIFQTYRTIGAGARETLIAVGTSPWTAGTKFYMMGFSVYSSLATNIHLTDNEAAGTAVDTVYPNQITFRTVAVNTLSFQYAMPVEFSATIDCTLSAATDCIITIWGYVE